MLTLASDSLEVLVIDPVLERNFLGSRYCAGTYIRQVSVRGGPVLLSGPEFPSLPSVINGQGAPEVFQHTLFDDPESIPEARMIIGVGLVENTSGLRHRDSHWNSSVIEPCMWSIAQKPETVLMETTQRYLRWQLALRRELHLVGNALHSKTVLQNTGTTPLPFRWFAHPFFPFHKDLRLTIEKLRCAVPPNPAFSASDDGTVRIIENDGWEEGFFLDLPEHSGMTFNARLELPEHPGVVISGSFPLSKLALWANDRTFSPEPFFAGEIGAGSSEEWTLTYTFLRNP